MNHTPHAEAVAPGSPADEGLERWRAIVARSPVAAEVRPFRPAGGGGGQEFHAAVRATRLGELTFARGAVGPHSKVRTPRLIRAAQARRHIVQLHLAGACLARSEERREILRPGAMVLWSGDRPFQISHPTDNRALFAYIPAEAAPWADDAFARVHGMPLAPDSGAACLLRGVLLNLSAQLAGDSPADVPARLAGTVLDLVEAALMEQAGTLPPDRGRLRRALMVQVQQDIEAHLRSDRVAPADIAARNHISKRTLHKLFEDQELTVSAWVRERRLRQCARDLRDPDLAGMPVASVAARWGLRDPARFSRVFRARFGATPRDYRRRHLAASDAQPTASR